ncbi:TIM-barrel domain-containing protein [Streptomyces swartbergensis]|uniref:TIM-barrel domain-containing protein n=1 Tax=Streptomyces swartbergensis TaxID=487165 RepID=UPI00313430EE
MEQPRHRPRRTRRRHHPVDRRRRRARRLLGHRRRHPGPDPRCLHPGHRTPAPPPEWASGFWQSKLRYRTQDELLAVARQHKERGLPLSVIICDFFLPCPKMGDWRFEESEWPEPAAMAEELAGLGVKHAVSVWPTVEPGSDTYDELRTSGRLVRDADGGLLTFAWPSREAGEALTLPMAYYDATHPGARPRCGSD